MPMSFQLFENTFLHANEHVKYRADTCTIDLATALEVILMGKQSASKIYTVFVWESQGK